MAGYELRMHFVNYDKNNTIMVKRIRSSSVFLSFLLAYLPFFMNMSIMEEIRQFWWQLFVECMARNKCGYRLHVIAKI
ncbi:unnamed protein product [Trifolium pratense]|uniref:Uncharacterized protein n=1 Tax=Trifolium pratense TaxID=57577 RepID=A0ACB0JFT8_TRIPR|nr:unnamed protein product [Trifolium pratense]